MITPFLPDLTIEAHHQDAQRDLRAALEGEDYALAMKWLQAYGHAALDAIEVEP